MRTVSNFSRSRVTLTLDTSYTAENVKLTLQEGSPTEVATLVSYSSVVTAKIVETKTLILTNRPESNLERLRRENLV